MKYHLVLLSLPLSLQDDVISKWEMELKALSIWISFSWSRTFVVSPPLHVCLSVCLSVSLTPPTEAQGRSMRHPGRHWIAPLSACFFLFLSGECAHQCYVLLPHAGGFSDLGGPTLFLRTVSLKSLPQWTGGGEIGLTGKWKVCRFSIFTVLPLFSRFGFCCFNLAMKMVRCIAYHSATCFFPLTIYHGHFSKSGPVGHSHSV